MQNCVHQNIVTVYHPDGHPILSGWRDEAGPRLWHFPLTAEAAQMALVNASPRPPFPLTAEATHVAIDTASPQLSIPPPPLRAPSADVCPIRLPLYDKNIADDAKTVVQVRAEVTHKSRLDDYASYEAAERGIAKFLRDVVDEIWYNDLKDAETFYTKVTAIEIMALLDANSGGLHAVDMISLCTNMTQYYVEADGIPQFIVMMEDAQKKAKRAGMPIADVELVMMASAAVLAAQHFLREVDDWEGLPAVDRTW